MKHSTWYRLLFALLVISLLLAACGDDDGGSDEDAGSTMRTIGINNPFGLAELENGFIEGLAEAGFTEGENVTYVRAEAGMQNIDDLLAAEPDLILCVATPACLTVQTATASIPTVFTAVTDPIAVGLVTEWRAPGGNFTGIASFSAETPTEGRRLEFLLQLAPDAQRVFVPHNAEDPNTLQRLATVQVAADNLGVELVLESVTTAEVAEELYKHIPEDVDAMYTFSESSMSVAALTSLADVAIERGLPYAAPGVEYGATLSYAPELGAIGGHAAELAARLLNGSTPQTTPVELARNFLSINLVSADAAGIEVPDELLRQADNVIRETPDTGDEGADADE